MISLNLLFHHVHDHTFADDSAANEKQQDEANEAEMLTKEWLLVAMILDWFFFLVFLFGTLITTLIVLLNRPDIKGHTYDEILEKFTKD